MSDEVFARAIDAMSDVQRRSVEAAGALVERLVASVDGNRHDVAEGDGEQPRPTDAEDAMAGFAKLWRDSITSLASAVSSPSATDGARIDVSAGAVPSPLRVVLDPLSRTATTEVWLHNPSAAALDKLRVHWGVPATHDGATLEPLSIVAEPDAFDLPARSSRGVELTVAAADVQPGTYRTLLLVDGLPDQWLPLEIVVPEPGP